MICKVRDTTIYINRANLTDLEEHLSATVFLGNGFYFREGSIPLREFSTQTPSELGNFKAIYKSVARYFQTPTQQKFSSE